VRIIDFRSFPDHAVLYRQVKIRATANPDGNIAPRRNAWFIFQLYRRLFGQPEFFVRKWNLWHWLCLIVVGIAALNLILDFDMIEQGSYAGAPQYMEWYGAFGLMVTLIWLYIEILRLLAKFASNRD
jgi:hypothetical protein